MKFGINNPAFLQMAGNAQAKEYFYIRSLADANEVTFANTKLGAFADNLEYSLDGNSWSPLSADDVITLNSGESILFRNPSNTVYNLAMGTNIVKTSDEYEVGGDIIKLFYPGIELPFEAFQSAFNGDVLIISASDLKLPATVLSNSCYSSMFSGCTSLTAAPELPATALAEGCYSFMFFGCTSLTAAPELPATALANSCYNSMFYECTSLTAAPDELPATALADSCYSSMFSGCTSLTAAPELPATALANSCYRSMFSGCTSLTAVTCLAEDISENLCTNSWLQNVAASGTFTKSDSMNDWTTGTDGIPIGWTVQNYVG